MNMKTARLIMNSLPKDNIVAHPLAKPGTMYNYKRANDKKQGKSVHHYAQRGELYFVSESK